MPLTSDEIVLPNDFVFALIGYRPDATFLRSMGLELDPRTERPALNAETLESCAEAPAPWCTPVPASVRVPAAVVPVPDRVGAAAACMVEATRGDA